MKWKETQQTIGNDEHLPAIFYLQEGTVHVHLTPWRLQRTAWIDVVPAKVVVQVDGQRVHRNTRNGSGVCETLGSKGGVGRVSERMQGCLDMVDCPSSWCHVSSNVA